MKKHSAILVCILSLSPLAFGASHSKKKSIQNETIAEASYEQESSSPSIISQVTPQAGISLSTVTGSGTESAKGSTGFAGGVTMDIGRSNLVFESGLIYRHMGATASEGRVNASLDLGYLSVPLMAKYYAGDKNSSSVYLKGGLVPMFLVSKSATLSNGSASISTSDVKVNSFDIGVSPGLGLQVKASESTAIILETSYLYGLTTVNSAGDSDAHNTGALIQVGLGFSL